MHAAAVVDIVVVLLSWTLWLQAVQHCWGVSLKRVLAGGRKHVRPLEPASSSPHFFAEKSIEVGDEILGRTLFYDVTDLPCQIHGLEGSK